MKFILHLITLSLLSSALYANTVEALASDLNLIAGEKATVQWERIFSSPRHMKKYKIDYLSQETRNRLKRYLIEHAADSEQPMIPGL